MSGIFCGLTTAFTTFMSLLHGVIMVLCQTVRKRCVFNKKTIPEIVSTYLTGHEEKNKKHFFGCL